MCSSEPMSGKTDARLICTEVYALENKAFKEILFVRGIMAGGTQVWIIPSMAFMIESVDLEKQFEPMIKIAIEGDSSINSFCNLSLNYGGCKMQKLSKR